MKIYAFHLLNDYSGSPKVLMQLMKFWVKKDIEVHMVTSRGRNGFLSNLKGVKYHYFWYRWNENRFFRLFNLLLSQFILLSMLLFKVKKKDIIYINTVLPFGAAFLGKLKGCRIIYHIHETTVKPALFKFFLFGIAKRWASDVIYVSKFLSEQEPFNKDRNYILHNAIELEFLKEANKKKQVKTNASKVLMVCSLKEYKGVNEFFELAKNNLNYRFRLVLNSSKQEIDAYFSHFIELENLEIYDTQTNLHPFYQWADIILNLSKPDGWVETFGLTIIEAMAYGIPAIVPPVGGIVELVEENKNGFLVDSRNTKLLHEKLNILLNNQDVYKRMATCSSEKIHLFREDVFTEKNLKILTIDVLV